MFEYPHKYLVFFILFIGLNIHSTFAQYEKLLNKSYAERAMMLDSLYLKIRELPFLEDAEKIADEIYDLGKKHNDRDLRLEKDLILAFYYAVKINQNQQQVIDKIEKVIEKANQQKNLEMELRATNLLSDFYWHGIKNYEMAFEKYLKMSWLLKKINDVNFPDMVDYYSKIATAYYVFRDYDTAIMFSSKTIDIPSSAYNWKFKWRALNTLALCYQKKNDLKNSDYYLRESTKSSYFGTDDIRYAISMGNIGYNLYLRGKYEEAEPLITLDLDNALRYGDMGLYAGAAIPLADIFLHKQKLNESWNLIEKAKQGIVVSGQTERYVELYTVMTRWYAQKGLFKESREYQDSTIRAIADKEEKFNTLLLLRAQQKADAQRMEIEKEDFLLREYLAQVRFIMALMAIAILIGASTFTYYYQHRKHTEKQKEKEAELEMAKQQLRNFTARITEKNEMIEQLNKWDKSENKPDIIIQLMQKTIFTEGDWDKFSSLFETVYPGYTHRLKNQIQGITPAEIRMIVLSKLRFSHKQMANALGVSPQASRVTWHRLRKKMDLNNDVSLEELADSI